MLLTVASLSVKATEERAFRVINAAGGLTDNSAQAVLRTKTGRMVISTLGTLNFYNGSTFSHIVTHREYRYPLAQYRGNDVLRFDRHHHLWLKSNNSVTCCDLILEQFSQNVDSVLRQMGCPMPVLDIFVDSIGRVWTLADEGLYGMEQKKFYNVQRDRNLQDVDVFDNMLLTFYDNGEEVGQDLSRGNTVHRTRAYEWETAQRYANSSSILRYKDGYFQLRNGDREAVLLYFDVHKLEWTILMEMPFHMNSMALKDKQLYIATEQGYCVYDIATQEQKWAHELTLLDGKKISVDCNALAFDRQGGMWVGTKSRGLLYSKPNLSPFKTIPIESPEAQVYVDKMRGLEQTITEFQGMNANCMFTDSRGWSWIGTTTGLYMYKDPHQEPLVFTQKTGLYNDVVHSVVEDSSHNIWLATSSGVSYIGFQGDRVEFVNSFNANDNVPSEAFVNCKAMLLPDSQIVMQTIDHVLLFRPETFTVNTPHPYRLYPKLTKLMVNGTTIEPNVPLDDNIVIDRAIARALTINLTSDQTTLSLIFSALNYFRPLQSYYNVRIKGMGKEEWQMYSYFNSNNVDDEGMLHLPLFDLEPGEYVVELQASMFPYLWEGEPYRWTIVVNQSWWQARGVYLLYGLVLLALFIANLILYIRNTRMRVKRNHEEGDVINKICMFVERADSFSKEPLSPSVDEIGSASEQQLAPEFIDIMEKLIPYVHENKKEDITMRKLGDVADVDIVRLYEVVTANIYKSPRDMVKQFRLRKAAELLTTTNKTIEEISDECGFYTPNYFMGNFFHEHKRTPAEYRDERQ